MKKLLNIYLIPEKIIVWMITLYVFFSSLKKEINEEDDGTVPRSELWHKNLTRKMADRDTMIEQVKKIDNSAGILKYIIPALVWFPLIKWIFNI